MSEIPKIKIYVQDSKIDCHRLSFHTASKKLGLEIGKDLEVIASEEQKKFNFPKDYDAYLIHLEDTKFQSIIDLKTSSPHAKIFGVSRGTPGHQELPDKTLEHCFSMMFPDDYEYIIRSTREIYRI